MTTIIIVSGKLPIAVDDDNDAQQVFTTTALELPHPQSKKEKTRRTTFNSCQDQDIDESVPPLPPKPLAG